MKVEYLFIALGIVFLLMAVCKIYIFKLTLEDNREKRKLIEDHLNEP